VITIGRCSASVIGVRSSAPAGFSLSRHT
jgi:hypothetical protein